MRLTQLFKERIPCLKAMSASIAIFLIVLLANYETYEENLKNLKEVNGNFFDNISGTNESLVTCLCLICGHFNQSLSVSTNERDIQIDRDRHIDNI